MQIDLQHTLSSTPKMAAYLRQNSHWYKYLNRNPDNYNKFVTAMKEKYKLRITDKMENVVDNVDMVSKVLNILK